jgi:hypothetical protein
MITRSEKVVTFVIHPDPPEYALIENIPVKLIGKGKTIYNALGAANGHFTYKYSHNQLTAEAPGMNIIHNKPIIECTKEEYDKRMKMFL